jgi:sec-independent protein translocase protein TatC
MPLDQPPLTPKGFEKEMSFLQHMEELRWHIVRVAVVLLVLMIGVFFFIQELVEYVFLGPLREDFPTQRMLCRLNPDMCLQRVKVSLQATDPAEQFTRALLISVVTAFVLAFPYLLWELWRFIRPGLLVREIRATRGIIGILTGLFLLGVSFGYFVVTPFTLAFFASFQLADSVQNIWRIGEVISLVVQLSLLAGLLFEMPVLAWTAGQLGLISARLMRSFRRHAIVAILLLAGILTPSPDIFTQLLLGIPMFLLYETSIIVVARAERRRFTETNAKESEVKEAEAH